MIQCLIWTRLKFGTLGVHQDVTIFVKKWRQRTTVYIYIATLVVLVIFWSCFLNCFIRSEVFDILYSIKKVTVQKLQWTACKSSRLRYLAVTRSQRRTPCQVAALVMALFTAKVLFLKEFITAGLQILRIFLLRQNLTLMQFTFGLSVTKIRVFWRKLITNWNNARNVLERCHHLALVILIVRVIHSF